jgi:uncharacterized LabA/DUF88 family protein
MSDSEVKENSGEEAAEVSETKPAAPASPPASSLNSHFVLQPSVDAATIEREDLEDYFYDLQDEVARLRRALALDPLTGRIPSNGGYAAPGGFLKRQNIAVFVDVQNMYHSAKKAFGSNLSYAHMLRACVRNRRLTRAFAYVIERDGLDQIGFTDHLRYCGFEVRKREVIERGDGSRKAEWELGMAMEMLRIADKVDVIVVVSGNGVFADVAPLIQAKGVKFECCSFKESMSDHLISAVDQYHILTEEHLYENNQD